MELITTESVAGKLSSYLHHELDLAGLVDWAVHAMMEGEFDPEHLDVIRDVVSRLREGGPVDVSAEVRALADAHPAMSIHLEVPAALTLEDDARAQALVRSVQEIMTNAVRHSGAGNLWIALRAQPGGVTLDARDDGRGAPSLRCGNGLKGMRERFEACAGRVEFITALDRGFEVHGFMPVPRPS